MGNAASIEKALEGEAKKLAKTSGFTADMLSFSSSNAMASKESLRASGITVNTLFSKVYEALELNDYGELSFQSFVSISSNPPSPANSAVVFTVFDFDFDGIWSRDEMKRICKMAFSDITDEAANEIINRTLASVYVTDTPPSQLPLSDFVRFGKTIPGIDQILTIDVPEESA